MELSINLSGLDPATRQAVVKGLQLEDRAQYVLGVLEQQRLARYAAAVSAAKYQGELRAQAVFSRHQAILARKKYGDLCFADPDWMPWALKRPEHADAKVKDAGSRNMVGWSPAMEAKPEPLIVAARN
jgi:hypothetical protein